MGNDPVVNNEEPTRIELTGKKLQSMIRVPPELIANQSMPGLSLGAIQGGVIASGQIGIFNVSGGWPSRYYSCKSCQCPIEIVLDSNEMARKYVVANGFHYCWNCADWDRRGERVLRDFTNDVPWEVVADWCEENGQQPDADWIRKYRCGT